MLAEIITIGDEILIGQVVDTNSAFIAKELNKNGISVHQITSIQDDREHILKALDDASKRVQVVIITGGLGPTKDDITKHTLCEFFNDKLILNQDVLIHVENLFAKFSSTPISEVNRLQAMVPSKATVLHNANGTAPGMWVNFEGVSYVSLPGVPFEMKALITNAVVPKIIKDFHCPHIVHKTLITYGLGESALAERIEEWEINLPSFIKLAYLPNFSNVRLRLSAKGEDKVLLQDAIEIEVEKLKLLIGELIFGFEEDETLEELIAREFTNKKLTLSTAESFTGGKIAQKITAIPGASSYFKGSVVSYGTDIKVNVLGVQESSVKTYSVVSAQVAKEMAIRVKELMKSDFSVATTGNAGPSKGDSDEEVGTVFIAIATPDSVIVEEFMMGKHRARVVQKSVNKAFELLKKELLKF